MKKNSYKGKERADLEKELLEKKKKLASIALGVQGGSLKEARILRKDIARILTELNAK